MIIRGPFNIRWGENMIEDVEEVSIDYDTKFDDYENVKGKVFELDRAQKISASITLLAADIDALALLLPQHFVPYAGVLSTGEVVRSTVGVIDMVPHRCDESLLYQDLDIISCGDPGQVTRIVNARPKIERISVDTKVQKITIKFIGEAGPLDASLQIYKERGIDYGLMLLETGGYFLLEDNGGIKLEIGD